MFMPLTLHFQIYVSFCHSLCTSYASHEYNSQERYSRFQEMGIIEGFFGVEINIIFDSVIFLGIQNNLIHGSACI